MVHPEENEEGWWIIASFYTQVVGEASLSLNQLPIIRCERARCQSVSQLVKSVRNFEFCSRQLLLAAPTRDECVVRDWFYNPSSLNEQVFKAWWGMKKNWYEVNLKWQVLE